MERPGSGRGQGKASAEKPQGQKKGCSSTLRSLEKQWGARSVAFTQEGGVGLGHTWPQDQAPAQLRTEESSAQARHTPNMVPQVISTTKGTTGTDSSHSHRQVKIQSGAAGDRAEDTAAAQVQGASWRPRYHQLKAGVHLEQPVRKPGHLGTRLGTDTPTT